MKKRILNLINFFIEKRLDEVLNEDGETCVPGGAYFSSPSSGIGGVTSPFQTLANTIGVGDPVPAGNNTAGSGDKFDTVVGNKIAKKKKAQEIKENFIKKAKKKEEENTFIKSCEDFETFEQKNERLIKYLHDALRHAGYMENHAQVTKPYTYKEKTIDFKDHYFTYIKAYITKTLRFDINVWSFYDTEKIAFLFNIGYSNPARFNIFDIIGDSYMQSKFLIEPKDFESIASKVESCLIKAIVNKDQILEYITGKSMQTPNQIKTLYKLYVQ